MFEILIALLAAGTSCLLTSKLAVRRLGIFGFALAWVLGIALAVGMAAMIKPKVDTPGWGQQGEKTERSLAIIVDGFWLAGAGAALGSSLALLRQRREKTNALRTAAAAGPSERPRSAPHE